MEATHPILTAVASLEDVVKDVEGVDPVFMDTAAKEHALLGLSRLQARVAELKLRVMATASDVAEEHGARDVGTWLAHEVHADRPDVRRDARLAAALTRYPVLAGALAAGEASVSQAAVIARALDALPSDLDPDIRERAEAHLVGRVGEFAPRQLRVLGRRILEVVAPEVGEEHERRLLEREEQHAERRTWLTTRDVGDGTTHLQGRLPTPVAGRLLTYLHAYTSPRQHRSGRSAGVEAASGRSLGFETEPTETTAVSAVAGEREPYPVQLGKALCAFLEHADPAQHPLHGGKATSVMVTIDLETLRSGLGVAATGSGEIITASEARRLACTAQVLPAVLGGRSELLDLGRARRLFSPAQRKALELRDRRCRAEGCDVPAPWTEAHHLRPWAEGGRTDLADGVLLCSHHHHRAHDSRYDMTRHPGGDFRFHRRT